MAWTAFVTHDQIKRCILCDAPVGVNSAGSILPTFKFMGDVYCEYCGNCLCPFCGKDNADLESGCEATDVYHMPMHYEVDVETRKYFEEHPLGEED